MIADPCVSFASAAPRSWCGKRHAAGARRVGLEQIKTLSLRTTRNARRRTSCARSAEANGGEKP